MKNLFLATHTYK